jgi:hypothetical protein
MRHTPVLAFMLLGPLAFPLPAVDVHQEIVPAPDARRPDVPQEVVAAGRLDSVVQLRDVRLTDHEITGTIVNLTDDRLSDLRLLVRDVFLWRNETRPGADDPSRAQELTVAGPIPPRGALQFTAPRTPPPLRTDGEFTTRVDVSSLVQQPVTAQVAPPPARSTVVTP